jgi:hypothetical protein
MDTARRINAAAALTLAALTTTVACGDEPGDTIRITSPSDGAEVTVPFEVIIDSSVPLGPPSEDVHHVHIWFGDDPSVFLVGESDVVQVDNAPNGEQIMRVSLHHADHTPAGAEVSVPLVIRGGADVPDASDY